MVVSFDTVDKVIENVKTLRRGGSESMKNTEARTVRAAGLAITYTLERKDVKNLNLRIHTDGQVYVSAGKRLAASRIDAFVISKVSFIQNAQRKFRELEQYRPQPKQYVSGETFYIQGHGLRLQVIQAAKESVDSDGVYIRLRTKTPDDFQRKERLMRRYLHEQCMAVFSQTLERLCPLFEKYGVARPTLRIRSMETRWGSCLVKKGIVTLNTRLLEAPQNCIEYVVMHELCHFIHPNHSKNFYGFLTMLMPDWKERRKALESTAAY